jgi:hypothetical protein
VETPVAECIFITEWTLQTAVTPHNIRDTGAETGTLKVEIPIAGAPNSRDARTDGNKINRRDGNHSRGISNSRDANNTRYVNNPETLETSVADRTLTAVGKAATSETLATSGTPRTSTAVRATSSTGTPETAAEMSAAVGTPATQHCKQLFQSGGLAKVGSEDLK